MIVKAWLEVIKGNTTDEHKRRASICKGCEHAKYKKYLDFKDTGLEEVKGYICNECSCPLVSKIRSTDKCYKWEAPTN